MNINKNSQASVDFDITRPLELTHGPILGAPKTGEKTIYIYSTAIDGVNQIRVATVAFGLNVGLSDEQEEALMERIADAFVGVEGLTTAPKPGSLLEAEAYLREGPGEFWEVRVRNALDDLDYVEFEVCALTMEDAAQKAEAVARKHADFYFDGAPEPTYHADRHNIYRMEAEEEPAIDDDPDNFPGYVERY